MLRLVRSRVRRLRPAPLSGLLAEGGAGAAGGSRQAAPCDGCRYDSLATEVTTDAFHGVTAVTVVAPDHPRLLTGIAGACAAAEAISSTPRSSPRPTGSRLTRSSFARVRARRGRVAARPADRLQHRKDAARRSPAGRDDAAKEARDVRRGAFAIEPEVIVDNDLVAPLHGRRSVGPRPAWPAAGPDRLVVEPQSQHRFGSYRHLRRKGGETRST